MSEGPRYVTVEEANAQVAALEIEFGRIARARAELEPLVETLGTDVAAASLERGAAPPPGRAAEAGRLRELAGELADAVGRVNDLGCLVKDLDQGLVDFHALLDGEPVLLCWQYGEPAVSHWHPVDQGFSARRPIEGVTVEPPEFPN